MSEAGLTAREGDQTSTPAVPAQPPLPPEPAVPPEPGVPGRPPVGPASYLWRALGIAVLSAFLLVFTELTYSLATQAPLTSAPGILGLFALLVLTLGLFAIPLGLFAGAVAYALARWRWRRPRPPGSLRWRRARRILGGVGVLGCLVAYVINASLYVRLYHDIHRTLTLLTFVGLNVSFLLITWGPRIRKAGRTAVVVLACLPILLGGALGGIHLLLTQRQTLKAYAFDRTTVLAHGLELISWLADVDGDRYSGLLGGGDCDEGDARRHPAAREIVDNGIDENCSGADLTTKQISATRKILAPEMAGSPATRMRRPWNVILITVDALRWDRVDQIAGLPYAPWIQTAASRGVFFRRAFSASSWTNSAVYAMLTSRYPSQVRWTPIAISRDDRILVDKRPWSAIRGLLENKKRMPAPIFDRTPTFAEILGKAGYATGTFPSYLFFLRNVGLTRGFATVDSWPYHALRRGTSGPPSRLVVDRALRFMGQAQTRRQNFFVWLHLMDPHEPYAGPTHLSDEQRYDREVKYADAQVGRLLQWLARRKLRGSTIVVLTADHGEEFRDHGGQYHGTTLYDEVIRVPLIFLVPRRRARRAGGVVSLIDIFPTVLELLGLPRPGGLMGRSLAPWIDGRRGVPPPRPVLAETFRFESEKRALIEKDYKLIHDRKHNTVELYGRLEDLRERINLADAQPKRTRAMRAKLDHYGEVLSFDAPPDVTEPGPVPSHPSRNRKH